MSQTERATSLGATGGLPGANAVPEASELTADELDDTVATGDVATTPTDPASDTDADDTVDNGLVDVESIDRETRTADTQEA